MFPGTGEQLANIGFLHLKDLCDLGIGVVEGLAKDGKINHRVTMPTATGSWATSIDCVNQLITDLVQPTAEMGRVIGAVGIRNPSN